jgi:transcriptional regulator with XRE-family HTH domain
VLTARGLQRLRQAIEKTEAKENHGDRYTIEEISTRAGISTSTISRLWGSSAGIDQRSLRLIFSAFNLELTAADFQKASQAQAEMQSVFATTAFTGAANGTRPEHLYPSGPVPLNSPFYILRPPIEQLAVEEIARPGCVLRIKAPSGFGSSSLLLRLTQQAETLGYAVATLDLRQADVNTLAAPDTFLRWFCVALSMELGLEPQLDDYWSDIVGNLLSTTLYFKEYVLAHVSGPLVLNVQELDNLFAFEKTARVFFPLLRSWHEEARHDTLWRQLRLIVSYATDSYLPLDINQSPFNVGLSLTLPPFTTEQVDALADRHQLKWSETARDRLMQLVGGHPALIRTALYHLSRQDLSLGELIEKAPTQQGIYHAHLQRIWVALQGQPQLLASLKALVSTEAALPLDPVLAYQLEGLGLIKATTDDRWIISCDLYRSYCSQYL